jgi:hypothetical protein
MLGSPDWSCRPRGQMVVRAEAEPVTGRAVPGAGRRPGRWGGPRGHRVDVLSCAQGAAVRPGWPRSSYCKVRWRS